MSRSLEVLINDDHVATLSEQNEVWQLTYTPDWRMRADAFDLAPSLPRSKGVILDGASERPVQWFFDNLLPEEQARQLLANDAKIVATDNFGLLAYYGAESAGAVTLLPDATQPLATGMKPLPDDVLSQRIRNLPRVALATGAPKRMSLAGAQHKLPVVIKEGKLFEPEGNTISTHILKPDNETGFYSHSVANEWFVMSLARIAGLNVPDVEIRRVPEPVYLIERFDRRIRDDEVERVHMLDGCQILGISSHFKYQQATMETMRKLIELVRTKAVTRIRLYKWLVFNLLVGNDDSHLKNLSFEVRPDGFELAPHYDLVCTSVYGAEPTPWLSSLLTWPLEGLRTHDDLTFEATLNMGAHLGLTARQSTRLLEEVIEPVMAEGPNLLKECQPQMSAGECRQTRIIWHGVIKDMHARLTR
ncbi:type II toxin-antitoxin system HipA family toxin [Pseudomonas nicosulfuronedens]|uniref:Type II toxin-antitoxin system HipA family toxin n=1 Tax=Pseudomonas nicosulfuronedens TaxID=2571105 RepID=A0A5R9QK67_9PSED|nr:MULTISPECIES: HipA domain-containing protein [Pseudomonas]TLX69609.1 type II toxin-antitoxin system HipA family toxin [Pseudomonas nicosulfuronedens]